MTRRSKRVSAPTQQTGQRERGRPQRAGSRCRRALPRLVRACGPGHADVSNALGDTLLGLGRSERRRARYTGF